MRPRWATAGIFFLNGAGVGTLLAHVPFMQERLDVSTGVIGLCLLAAAAGALVAMPIAGHLLDRRPSRTVVRAGAFAYPLLLALPLLASTPLALAAFLVGYGAANGWLDVSMNAHGSAVERDLGRPIMSSLHAGWSLGGVAGAGGAALSAAAGVDPRVYVAGAAAALIVLAALLAPRLGAASAERGEAATGFALPSRGVVLLGVLCVLVMVTEGAMNDWSALYLTSDLDTGPDVGAAGFAAFSAGMAAGRLGGDALAARIGSTLLLRGGATLATVALAVTLAAGQPGVALVGFALVGLGVANGVPLMFSAAGRTENPGSAIAAVATMGYVAFLAGPPLIGFLADAIGLPGALATICLAAGTVALLGGRTERRPALAS
jgi:predicted MFS family arabinose efflux permease